MAQGPLAGISDQTLPVATQVYDVKVDPEAGEVEIARYAAVEDVRRAINPTILHGQTHRGIAEGVGQALLENSYYEPRRGQLLAASFMDYAIPRADTMPFLATALSEVPSPANRLGVRFGGEGGTTPALAAVTNAIVVPSLSSECATSKCRRSRNGSGAQFRQDPLLPRPRREAARANCRSGQTVSVSR